MIRIVNIKNYVPVEGETLIRVDRTAGSPLGNPFYMRGENQRDSVCDKYALWLDKQIKSNRAVCDELNRIWLLAKKGNNIALGCFCAPKRCHAEYIREKVMAAL